MRSAQAAAEIIGARLGISPALQGLRGKLVMLATLAEGDLKAAVGNRSGGGVASYLSEK